MEETMKIKSILTLAMAFCFGLASLAQAEEKAKSLMWVEHKPNPRFAIYDPGNRKGWRLPTVEELASLVYLPSGHPFINVQSGAYWSSTTYEAYSGDAFGVYVGYGRFSSHRSYRYYVWPVRGGN